MAIPTLDIFQVIADPSRRQILHLLTRDSYNISTLAENFKMSRPAVSKHISILQTAGFITIREIGRERFCMINENGFIQLRNWLSYFDLFWQSKLQHLETALARKGKKHDER